VYPLAPIKRQRELRHERILTQEEEARLLAGCDSPLREVIQVALDTGFRESEVVALRRPMVNLRENLLTVPSAYAKIRETRTVEMTTRVRSIFNVALQRIGPRDTDTPLLGYQQSTSVKRAFRREADRVGLRDVRFHDLRHTFGTRLLLAGVPLVKVQKLMGHKTVGMTMRYLTLTDGDLRGVIRVLDQSQPPAIFTTATSESLGPSLQPLD
jgi:integrase